MSLDGRTDGDELDELELELEPDSNTKTTNWWAGEKAIATRPVPSGCWRRLLS